jgi:hypothetical protein
VGRRTRRERPGPEGDVVGLDGKGPVERVADLYRYLKRPPSAAIAMFYGQCDLGGNKAPTMRRQSIRFERHYVLPEFDAGQRRREFHF